MKLNVFGLAVLFSLSSWAHSNTVDPLIGTWKVIDQRTGYYVSDIIVRKDGETQEYSAVINKAYPLPGAAPSELCTQCKGTLKNQPLFAMPTLKGLIKNKQTHVYQQGIWLNPQDGQEYLIEGTLNPKQDQMKMKVKLLQGLATGTLIWKKI